MRSLPVCKKKTEVHIPCKKLQKDLIGVDLAQKWYVLNGLKKLPILPSKALFNMKVSKANQANNSSNNYQFLI